MKNEKFTNSNSEKFNNYELFQIVKEMKYNPYYAFSEIEDYLSRFPDDCYAYSYYIKLLIDLGRFEEAFSVLDFAENTFPDKIDINFIFGKIRALIFTGKYEEAYKIYTIYKDELISNDFRMSIFETICAIKVKNASLVKDISGNRYLYNQLIDYSYDDFLVHMQKHMADYNIDSESPNPVIFSHDFPFDKVLSEIDKLIPNNDRIHYSFFYNFYVFKYDANGRINNKTVDYFRVVTFHNTKDIITMYPMQNGSALPYVDLNYLNDVYDSKKVKKLSRVDRFNQKYSNFVK